jgi:hypothetical protein
MMERAAHLVDAVLPWVPVRQWVLTVPYRLRYQMAWNHGLTRAMLREYNAQNAGDWFLATYGVVEWRGAQISFGCALVAITERRTQWQA